METLCGNGSPQTCLFQCLSRSQKSPTYLEKQQFLLHLPQKPQLGKALAPSEPAPTSSPAPVCCRLPGSVGDREEGKNAKPLAPGPRPRAAARFRTQDIEARGHGNRERCKKPRVNYISVIATKMPCLSPKKNGQPIHVTGQNHSLLRSGGSLNEDGYVTHWALDGNIQISLFLYVFIPCFRGSSFLYVPCHSETISFNTRFRYNYSNDRVPIHFWLKEGSVIQNTCRIWAQIC